MLVKRTAYAFAALPVISMIGGLLVPSLPSESTHALIQESLEITGQKTTEEVIVPDTKNILDIATAHVGPSVFKMADTRRFGIDATATDELDLLPDLVPLPPRDLVIDHTEGRTRIWFSTTYYNQGDGPLEFYADPETAGIAEDIERTVFQRIYRSDETHRSRDAGTFLWHQPHLHYHFSDFVLYHLEAVDVPGSPDIPDTQEKATFCVRDISRVETELPNRPPDAEYKICGKELQGVSVGWGDTYFYNYPDQNLDITGLPSGTYQLSFIVNPSDRFDEITLENNTASALLRIDQENLTVEVLEEIPENSPAVEHVYEEQQF